MVAIGESPSERVKRYLAQALVDLYGAGCVTEKDFSDKIGPIGTFTAPLFTVVMEADEVDERGAICHAVVVSQIQNLNKETAHENIGNLLYHFRDNITRYVDLQLPIISSVAAPWYKVVFTTAKAVGNPNNVRCEWKMAFHTGIIPGGVR